MTTRVVNFETHPRGNAITIASDDGSFRAVKIFTSEERETALKYQPGAIVDITFEVQEVVEEEEVPEAPVPAVNPVPLNVPTSPPVTSKV